MSTTTERVEQPASDVVEIAPTARWGVETHSWSELPDDVIALVATSVVVCAESR